MYRRVPAVDLLSVEYRDVERYPEMASLEHLEEVRKMYLAMIEARKGNREALLELKALLESKLEEVKSHLEEAESLEASRAWPELARKISLGVWQSMKSRKKWLIMLYEGLIKEVEACLAR